MKVIAFINRNEAHAVHMFILITS